MGLGDILFGRKKLKGPARDRLFALTTSAVTLGVECGLQPAGAGAVVFKPLSAGDFARVEQDVEQLLHGVAADAGSTIERKSDTYGFEWVIVRDPDLEDQVTGVYGVANGLTEQGFGSQLLAAAFRFDGEGSRPVYWIYGFKTGTFWPFVPTGEQQRDNARELELKAKLEKELPVEQDLSKWFALFDAPI
jgi:hypothetical protein